MNLTYTTSAGVPPLTKGTLKLQRVGGAFGQGGFNLYSAPGPWTLTALSIFDEAGNGTRYSQDQLAGLFPSLTVNVTNVGTPDTAVPLISPGKLLTPEVSLGSASPTFDVSMAVSDDISGVQFGEVSVAPPDNSSGRSAQNSGPSPILNGNLRVFVPMNGATVTGQWKILQFGSCDVAGNCSFDNNPADVQSLFGTTTFQVTN